MTNNKSSQSSRQSRNSRDLIANSGAKRQPPISEASKISNKKYFLLDVRTHQEFQTSHIPGSILIPMDQISANLEKLRNIKQTILIICRSAARATVVQDFLIKNNITNTEVLKGGIVANPHLLK